MLERDPLPWFITKLCWICVGEHDASWQTLRKKHRSLPHSAKVEHVSKSAFPSIQWIILANLPTRISWKRMCVALRLGYTHALQKAWPQGISATHCLKRPQHIGQFAATSLSCLQVLLSRCEHIRIYIYIILYIYIIYYIYYNIIYIGLTTPEPCLATGGRCQLATFSQTCGSISMKPVHLVYVYK